VNDAVMVENLLVSKIGMAIVSYDLECIELKLFFSEPIKKAFASNSGKSSGGQAKQGIPITENSFASW